jgi:3-oxoacyl-[acyl-carrier protein] reductase
MNKKTIVITGASGQVGSCLVKKFLSQGHNVIGIVRSKKEIESELSGCIFYYCSTTDSENLKKVVEEIKNKFAGVDILINCTGYTKTVKPQDIKKITDEMFNEIIDNNLKGTFITIREFFDIMNDNSVIINMSSTAGLRASQSNLVYGASKAGIDLITKSLAKALAPKTRVVAIAPGYLEHATSGVIKAPDFNERISQTIPMKRVLTSNDVLNAVESIISMNMLTGITLVLDGGINA